MKKQQIDVNLIINGIEVNVGCDFLESIVSGIPDIKENKKLFEVLASSSNYEVREYISRKDNLNRKTVAVLLEDEYQEVVGNILNNSAICKFISIDQIDLLIKQNNSFILCSLAKNTENLINYNTCKLIKKLAKNESSKVRHSLFRYPTSSHIPFNILQDLCKDGDFDVAIKAKEELKERISK